jgi:hypothetical protein
MATTFGTLSLEEVCSVIRLEGAKNLSPIEMQLQ